MRRPEQSLQIQIADYLHWAAPDLIWFHPANGGKRTPREAALFKAIGVRAGVSDLIFCLPGGQFGAVELKADKGRMTPEQMAFANAVVTARGRFAEARTLDGLIATLALWGVKFRARAA